MTDNPGIRAMQDAIWWSKVTNGENTDNLPQEFFSLKVKVDKALRASKRRQPALADNLADIYACLLGIAMITGSDLQHAVAKKFAVITAAAQSPDYETGKDPAR